MGGGFRSFIPVVFILMFAGYCTAGQVKGSDSTKTLKNEKRSKKTKSEDMDTTPSAAGASTVAEDEDEEAFFTKEVCTEARVQPAAEACYPPIAGLTKDWTAFVQATVDEKGTVIKAKTLQVLLSSGLDTPQINAFKKSVQTCAEKNVMNGAAQPMLCGNRPAGAQVVVPVRPVHLASPTK